MRFACDTGGTFTDLVVEADDGSLSLFKAPTTPDDPIRGVLDSLALAAAASGETLAGYLGRAEAFIHGTTHAINAIITGRTARTAFLTTEGHPDILVLREGGRAEPFNFSVPYPEPYIPRALTFEVPERIGPSGAVMTALDEAVVAAVLDRIAERQVEAVAVCLLWSIVNPAHELRIGEMIAARLPEVPFTLSHQLNPALREYRRASSTAIDASLKPLMSRYLGALASRLRAAGFGGRLLVLTSAGGMLEAEELAAAPIHVINSGPSLAPIAGRHYTAAFPDVQDVVVADTGGTTYDVSLVRNGTVPMTRETWIGQPFRGHITGFPSVDVKSIGAGGGSIAWVDSGHVLHVGPMSAGAVPGPACYGEGGTEATLTDACLVSGFLDPAFFLGGRKLLDLGRARAAVGRVAERLGKSVEETAAAIVGVSTETMVQAIEDITVNQGIDPAGAALVGGGGAAGLNAVFVARRLGCRLLVIPEVGAALSAAGALMSELTADYRQSAFAATDRFDADLVNGVLAGLEERCRAFIAAAGATALDSTVGFACEARYAHQVWEIDVPVRAACFGGPEDVAALVADFHAAHEQIFGFRDEGSAIEIIGWAAQARCRVRTGEIGRLAGGRSARPTGRRPVFFPGHGAVEVPIHDFAALAPGEEMAGPAIVETPFTTVVIDPPARFSAGADGSLVIRP